MDPELIHDIKKYKKEDYATLRIHRRIIAVKEIEGEEWMGDTQIFIKGFIKAMKIVEPIFKKLCKNLVVAGSVSENLRLVDSREIDFNLEIVLPQNFELRIKDSRMQPGFHSLKLVSYPKKKITDVTTCIVNWTDDQGYILQNEFSSWMQSIVSRTLTFLTGGLGFSYFPYTIKESASGPAKTFSFFDGDTFLFDADLVPIILYKKSIYVPKPSKTNPTENRLFLQSFREKEKDIMFDQHYLKPTIRLMKKFRDSYPELKHFKSYFIKMAFILELEKHPFIWKGIGISGLFVHMLKTILEEYLKPEELLCRWTKRNLLKDTAGLENMQRTFRKAIERIESEFEENPHVIGEVILTDEQELINFKNMVLD